MPQRRGRIGPGGGRARRGVPVCSDGRAAGTTAGLCSPSLPIRRGAARGPPPAGAERATHAVNGQRARRTEGLTGGPVARRTGSDGRTGRGGGLAVPVFPSLHDARGGQAGRADPGALERLQARPAPRWWELRAPVGGGDGRRATGSAGAADDVRDGGAHDRPLFPDDGGPARRAGARGRRGVPRDQVAARARDTRTRPHRGRARHPGTAADHRGAEPERDLPGRAVKHEVDAGCGAPAADRPPAAFRDAPRHR